MGKNNVILFSPNKYSLYTITVCELLKRSGVEIAGVVCVRLLNPSRFFSEFRRDGSRLLKKIWNKFFLKKRAYGKYGVENIRNFMENNNIFFKSIEEFCHINKVQILYCKTLNDFRVEKFIKEKKPRLVLFTGGGLIRKNILELAGDGVLNCHMGILPEYRGMDVVEWPLLLKDYNRIGFSIHFMDEGVDTGDILKTEKVEILKGDNILSLRTRFESRMCQTFVETCLEYMEGKIKPKEQNVDDGKQYFKIHQKLQKVAELNLSGV